MDAYTLCMIGTRLIEVFMLQHGYEPSGGFDIGDPNCYREYGPHVIITMCGHALPGAVVDVNCLWKMLTDYFAEQNKLPSAIKFQPYDLGLYDYPEAIYIYISICL